MKLLFTTSFSLWIIFAFAAIIFTFFIYRRHSLPSPWSFWLPFLRIVTLLLLGLLFFQPVISKVWSIKERGRIPVLIDTSASMGINDDYSDSDALAIAWQFNLFPRELRNTEFQKLSKRLNKKSALFTSTETKENDIKISKTKDLSEILQTLESIKPVADKICQTTSFLKPTKQEDKKNRNESLLKNGKVLFEKYNKLSGNLLSTLTKAKKYPGSPDKISYLDSFAIPSNQGDHYGSRLSAYIIPPVTGEYTFFVSADDQCRLTLHKDSKSIKLAFLHSHSSQNQYDKYPQQKSKKVMLIKNKRYYIEALHKEGWGEDHLSVGWLRPDDIKEFPIPSTYCVRPADTVCPTISFQNEYKIFTRLLNEAIPTLAELIKQDKTNQAKLLFSAKKLISDLTTSSQKLQHYFDGCLALTKDKKIQTACEKVKKTKRIKWLKKLLTQKPFMLHQKLSKLGEVELYALDSEKAPSPIQLNTPLTADLPVTRLGSTLTKILGLYKNKPVSAMLLLSDGNNNSGKSFPEVKKIFSDQEVPIVSIGFGKKTDLKDLCIEKITAPTTSFKDDKLTIRAVIRRPGYEDEAIKIKVVSGNKTVLEKIVPPSNSKHEEILLPFIEKREGLQHYTVSIAEKEGEALTVNNSKSVSINVLKDPIKALLVDEYPRWESRYINMMLKRDKRISLDTVFTSSAKVNKKAANIPTEREKLFRYDVLILGDLNPSHLSTEQKQAIKDFITQRGGCCIIMAGPNFMPNAYRDTPLAGIMPFKIKPQSLIQSSSKGSLDSSNAQKLRLTEFAKHENITQLGDTPANSNELWDKLSGINWLKEGIIATPNAELLVETKTDNQPVILSAFMGSGKVLFIATDSFWKWRKRLRWKYHHRFWAQVMLWATTGRTTGSGRFVKLMTERPIYSPDETVTVRARVLKDENTPLENGTLKADILDQNGKLIKHIFFNYIDNSGGEYRTQLKGLPIGKYTMKPSVKELSDKTITALYSFEVKVKPAAEYINLSLNEAELRYLSENYTYFSSATDILKDIPKITITEEKRQDYEIWNSFYVLFAAAFLLTIEWAFRKRLKLL